ncbi:MAG: methyltransferase domain-containing protein [Synechococcaceae cyanobacterium SM2_3_60]|nr:methyltransferase domain-containing protein [Synechococcaceae cyanobacterium SM2_3_60]
MTSVLAEADRGKLDPTSDTLFYDSPRFVYHVDTGFVQQLTQLYRELLPPDGRIFDLMSSWVSHLPPEVNYRFVQGHGLNGEELARNERLDAHFVQNLNENQVLPLDDASFDAVLNTVSVQYMQYPERIFAEIYRVLKPNGIAIISFSNRMFPHKAIQAWLERSDAQRLQLVKRYFESVQGFGEIETIAKSGRRFLVSGDPF